MILVLLLAFILPMSVSGENREDCCDCIKLPIIVIKTSPLSPGSKAGGKKDDLNATKILPLQEKNRDSVEISRAAKESGALTGTHSLAGSGDAVAGQAGATTLK